MLAAPTFAVSPVCASDCVCVCVLKRVTSCNKDADQAVILTGRAGRASFEGSLRMKHARFFVFCLLSRHKTRQILSSRRSFKVFLR